MKEFNNKKKLYIFVCFFIVIVSIIICLLLDHNDSDSKYEIIETNIAKEELKSKDNTDNKIIVYVLGEVNSPGVIEANEGDRLKDIVEKAGGFTCEADRQKVNLAYQVEDGQKIIIPNSNAVSEQEEIITSGAGANIVEKSNNKSKININKATQTELETLTGIGPSMANKIIEYRSQNGKYTSVEDLKKVPGIGNSKYEAIKDYIVAK